MDLIERLEKCTGPDRGIDALIAAKVGWDGWTVEEWEPFTRGEPGKDWAPEHPPVMDRCPEFTKSLDVVMTLIPDNAFQFSLEWDDEPVEFPISAGFMFTNDAGTGIEFGEALKRPDDSDHPNWRFALLKALLIAALRARQTAPAASST